ncbi:MAG: hypothetical protein MJ211_05670 [Bacteroidales bacterium]|nr:hypothetical protein [Bacteroidales bacterium]
MFNNEYVSIPKGSIKRNKGEHTVQKFYDVSIPKGSIKRMPQSVTLPSSL